MGAVFWIRRFVLVFFVAFVVIAGAQWLRGHSVAYSAYQGMIWAAISTTLFIGARMVQSSRGRHCALCGDTPEPAGMHSVNQSDTFPPHSQNRKDR